MGVGVRGVESSDLDCVSNQPLKLSLPYIVDSFTYIFNLPIDFFIFFPPLFFSI